MDSNNIQHLFFQKIKEQTPAHISLVDEIAELLNLSNDSVYRRLRGEKPIQLDEIQKLCAHYKISMDQFLNLQTDAFSFRGQLRGSGENSFEEWINGLRDKFKLFNSVDHRHMKVLMKDIPPFVHFQIEELALFKFYFWMKSVLNYESFKGVKFDLEDEKLTRFLPQTNEVVKLNNQVPVTEVWNIESLNSSIRQINFFHEAGAFKSKSIAHLLYDKLLDLIQHIEVQAEAGIKFPIGSNDRTSKIHYHLYVNELILGDNTYLVELNDKKLVFLNHSVLFIIGTANERFTQEIQTSIENMVKKSTLISEVGEKERARFFNKLKDEVKQRQSIL